MKDEQTNIQRQLFDLQDLKYKEFSQNLMPTVDKATVIGVRTPLLRKYAKDLTDESVITEFMKELPHKYYEENNLHGFLIEKIKDYDVVMKELKVFLPYIDNWATCDLISPKVFKKHLPELYETIKVWLKSKEIYTVRFGIGMLMSWYLDDQFEEEHLKLVAEVKSAEYYINMMIAWYFATALTKQYTAAVPYIENKRLDKWTHNKTIQKAIESRRISEETKNYLRQLKIK